MPYSFILGRLLWRLFFGHQRTFSWICEILRVLIRSYIWSVPLSLLRYLYKLPHARVGTLKEEIYPNVVRLFSVFLPSRKLLQTNERGQSLPLSDQAIKWTAEGNVRSISHWIRNKTYSFHSWVDFKEGKSFFGETVFLPIDKTRTQSNPRYLHAIFYHIKALKNIQTPFWTQALQILIKYRVDISIQLTLNQ